MKKVLFVSLITLAFCSCSGNLDNPAQVAKEYVENIAHGNIDKATTYTTKSSAKLLDFTKRFPVAKDEEYKFVLIKDSIVDNAAWVTYKTMQGEEDVLALVKEDGKWKVSLGD